METVLIWLGSGFAFGVGLMVGMVIMTLAFRKRTSEERDQTERSIAALLKRNLIGIRHAEAMERIADHLDSK